MKRVLAAVLTLAVLLAGFFLPTLVTGIQDKNAVQVEDVSLQQVDLNEDSGLTIIEKLQMLSDETSTQLAVGVGRVQTIPMLSQNAWVVLDNLTINGAAILDPATTVQEQQSALLVSNGGRAYIVWQILFNDGNNNICWLYLDDETGLPLSISCCASDDSVAASWLYVAGEAMLTSDGLWLDNSVSNNDAIMESAVGDSNESETGVETFELAATDGSTQFSIPLESSYGWLTVNPVCAYF
ncbi:MAG: hypothetical protein VB055_05265 [Oscillospiraceae bacterium]|nr:hypothetical protein [Oscillospiraceae bacterium]